MKFKILLTTLILGLCCNLVQAKITDTRIQSYIDTFKSGNISEIKSACSNLEWEGISDTKLYDLIEMKVINRYRSDFNAALPFMIRALGYSGKHEYRTTLDKIVIEGKDEYKPHAKDAIRNIFKYEKWNKLISDNTNNISSLSANENRIVNMLNSDIYILMRMGAKRIHYKKLYSKKFLNVLQQSITKHLNSYSNDKYYEDTMAWMLKALGRSKNEKYVQTFIKVIDSSQNHSVSSSANRFLDYYGISHTKKQPKIEKNVSPEELGRTYDSEIAEEILNWK